MKRQRDTQGRSPREDKGKVWIDAATSPGTPRIFQKMRRSKKGSFPRAFRGSVALLTP